MDRMVSERRKKTW